MEKRTRSYSYPPEPYVPESYEPMERDKYVPAEAFPEPCGQVNMIHKTNFSKREIKKFSREVKYAEVAMVDTPEFIDWSEQSISFDRTDHPKAVPRPGHAALVLEAQIGGYNMSKEGALIEFLRDRWEIFAWESSDMPGIPRELAEHALNVDPTAKPVQQPMRRFSEPKRRAIGEEVNRLRKAGFIRELKEAEWVANPVMVPKKDTTALRMCIDYTGLNKHCPKDHFPLPHIDQIVDSTAGCDRLSFLDVYSGYNQIKLKKEDQELTAFITPHGVFCYNVMTFGLKNAGATYQRCMQACLGEQIGRNIEVYIDDIVVKTKYAATLIDDLRETFDNLDKYKSS
ncbi:hypothetical protein QYE76_041704 [Lolium multiflorum]|uniref:Reverse transcriptase domain-containing protein n=1 Tax=Lolium multiflorum TaxID=4521 RepID=A0AAD8TEB6_LOLMU|nr:hypothetical protein QYE76_041704 [Lolium multiflorum]